MIFYGLFLTAISIKAPTIATAIIIAMPVPMMYISVEGILISGYGEAVGVDSPIAMYVCADEPP